MSSSGFRALHEAGCFILPNPWDVGSAIYLHRLGFPALATTSAGFAFSRGLPESRVGVDAMLAHVAEIVGVTPLPVNADLRDGYASTLDELTENVLRCVETGVAGLSIEDHCGSGPLYPLPEAVDRLRAARAAIDSTGVDIVLTARCEGPLIGVAFDEVLTRLAAYAAAGADCLYAPGLRTPAEIAAVVSCAAPLPVNVLVGEHGPATTVAALADLGVRRVSLGSSLARSAWGAFVRAARAMSEDGSFAELEGAEPFARLNHFFTA